MLSSTFQAWRHHTLQRRLLSVSVTRLVRQKRFAGLKNHFHAWKARVITDVRRKYLIRSMRQVAPVLFLILRRLSLVIASCPSARADRNAIRLLLPLVFVLG
jgi:hypothetical protein